MPDISPDALFVLIAVWVFNAVVDAMPIPDDSSGKAYRFAFSLLHNLAKAPIFLGRRAANGSPSTK